MSLSVWWRSGSARWSVKRERRAPWQVEALEGRLLLSALTPAQVSHAYGVDQVIFGSVKGDGTGQTIAIIDAYDAPNINSDLAAFNAAFGLPNTDGKGAPVLTVAKPSGTPAYNANWALETTLDVEWAHAIAPGAHILLVEAASSGLSDLLAAVDYARNQPGVSVVSMSWGAGEFSFESLYDSYFTTPSGHQGVSFVASSGDQGGAGNWPALSTNVLAVGGTSLYTSDSLGTYSSEVGWSGSGGGISAYESKPTYQSSVTQSSTNRTGPDVSYDADPNTGVQVLFNGGWIQVGGTSAGAPQWAAIVAIADQGRALAGKNTLDSRNDLLPAIYGMSSTNFHDITSGSTTYAAGTGYDLVTGRGSPYADRVVADLLNVVSSGGSTGGSTGGTGGSTGGTGGSTGGGGSNKGGGKGKPKTHAEEFAIDALWATPSFDLAGVAGTVQLELAITSPASGGGTSVAQELSMAGLTASTSTSNGGATNSLSAFVGRNSVATADSASRMDVDERGAAAGSDAWSQGATDGGRPANRLESFASKSPARRNATLAEAPDSGSATPGMVDVTIEAIDDCFAAWVRDLPILWGSENSAA